MVIQIMYLTLVVEESLPSSIFVPLMNGIFAKLPRANTREGRSGYNPPGPSIVGSNANCSGDLPSALRRPVKISLELACWRQSKVWPEVALDAHEATPVTKFSQSISRRAARKLSELA